MMHKTPRTMLAGIILLALLILSCNIAQSVSDRAGGALAGITGGVTPTQRPRLRPTFTPTPDYTPTPTNTPKPAPPTDTPAPVPTPTPDWTFKMKEEGNRALQKTTNTNIFIIFALTDGNNTPIGGLYVMGQHSSGKTYKSPASSWQYDAANGFVGGYIKQGNLKVEPGPFEDGTWNFYVADSNGTQLSDIIPFSYASDPNQWVWDFIWLTK